MKKIKVLQLIETFGTIGGAERVALDLTQSLNPDEFDTHLAIVKGEQPLFHIPETLTQVTLLPGGNGISRRTLQSIMAIMKSNDIDITHSHLTRMNTYNALASRLTGRPSVGSNHGIMAEERTFLSRQYIRWAARLNSITVTVSNYLRMSMINDFGVSPKKLKTIYNGFDEGRVLHKPEPRELAKFRESHKLPENARVIAAVGHLRTIKGYDTLLEAIALLRPHFDNLFVLIAGRSVPDETPALEELWQKLGLKDRVIFLGEFTDLPLLFETADLYVSSSRHEGFSLTTVEAMAYGLPTVVTDSGGPSEIVENGLTGIVVPVADTKAMSRAIATIMNDKAQATAFGQAGKKRAYDQFSYSRFIEQHEEVYRMFARRKNNA